jgi:hypothetical protein
MLGSYKKQVKPLELSGSLGMGEHPMSCVRNAGAVFTLRAAAAFLRIMQVCDCLPSQHLCQFRDALNIGLVAAP